MTFAADAELRAPQARAAGMTLARRAALIERAVSVAADRAVFRAERHVPWLAAPLSRALRCVEGLTRRATDAAFLRADRMAGAW